ncbi:hypothetical protein, partial [Anaerorhabdus sp.]|uniref:hypothetical protein n=1 Tax=Anaerorhabdus sp. TaxID=1872524 RepID=UPI002FCA7F8E
ALIINVLKDENSHVIHNLKDEIADNRIEVFTVPYIIDEHGNYIIDNLEFIINYIEKSVS